MEQAAMALELQRYINDHLNGSRRALDLTHDLMERQKCGAHHQFLTDLAHDISRDREALKGLLSKAGLEEYCSTPATGNGRPSVSKDIEPSGVGIAAALEMLSVSIQSKRLLWVALGALVPWFPEWHPLDFRILELDAIRQKDGIGRLLAELTETILSGTPCMALA